MNNNQPDSQPNNGKEREMSSPNGLPVLPRAFLFLLKVLIQSGNKFHHLMYQSKQHQGQFNACGWILKIVVSEETNLCSFAHQTFLCTQMTCFPIRFFWMEALQLYPMHPRTLLTMKQGGKLMGCYLFLLTWIICILNAWKTICKQWLNSGREKAVWFGIS